MSTHRSKSNAGFTLIEVLVSIVLVALGLIGLAGLQARTLAEAANSGHRSLATQQAANLSDAIRANREAFNSGGFDITAPASPTVASGCLGAAGCTAAQMAAATLRMWNNDNARVLPGGIGTVCIDATPHDGTPTAFACDGVAGAPYVIKVWWDEDRTGTTATFRRFATALNP